MKRFVAYWSCILSVALFAETESDFELTPQTTIHWANASEAQVLLSRSDAFTQVLSPFDRAVRMKSGDSPDQDTFLSFVGKQALDWSAQEIDRMKECFQRLKPRLAPFTLPLPDQILMVKTTGLDEPAPYTRQNAIILSKAVTGSPRPHDSLLAHELFHVLSRNAPPGFRSKLYAILGFKPCNPIELPKDLGNRRITNPDSPLYDHFIQLQFKNEPTTAIPILLSQTSHFDPANAQSFFSYLEQQLLVIERKDGAWAPKHINNKSVVLGFEDVGNFYEQIGGKRYSVFQPEEILARHFTALIMAAQASAEESIGSKLAALLK